MSLGIELPGASIDAKIATCRLESHRRRLKTTLMKLIYGIRVRCGAVFLFIVSLALHPSLRASGTITNCTEVDLRKAMLNGGLVKIKCDGVLSLTNTLVISTNTILDATGQAVALSGGGAIRLFVINPGINLTLK